MFNMLNSLNKLPTITNRNWMNVDYSILFNTITKLVIDFKKTFPLYYLNKNIKVELISKSLV